MYIHRYLLGIVVMFLALAPAGIGSAQQTDLAITIQPESGPPGTSVTISGQGAPPDASVRVLVAPFQDIAACRTGRGADTVAVVTADANGRFSATHTAQRLQPDQAGNTYLAQLNQGPVPRPDSNLECFTFGEGQEERYFPETDNTVSDEFLNYWRENGGLAVFGYPLTERIQEDSRDVQYFERQRFEFHPENQPPYNILLGRLGVQLLERQGVDWRADQEPQPNAQCLWFGQTRHNVCDQGVGAGFRTYWLNNGLEFDGQPGTSYEESLALFGYPVTTAEMETNSSGDTVLTQWFERARFEWHPDNPQGSQVLLGRLGAELLQGQGESPGQEPPTFSEVQMYLIALGDEGQSGPEIGCGDSVIPVTVNIEPTTAPLTAAIEQLLAVDSEYYGQSGLYNALHRSDLQLDSATVENGVATIYLTGDLQLGGACDNPRVEAQIEQTALQFSTVNEVVVYLNGQRLEEVLAGDGAPTFTEVQVYLIALGDEGQSGPEIGCGDSVIPVTMDIEPTTAPLTAAIEELLAINSQYYGQSGLYNALHQSDLQLDSATVENEQATIYLTGDLQLGGACDNPRVEAQIEQTALQFSTVDEVVVYLNGQRLEDVLSEQGISG